MPIHRAFFLGLISAGLLGLFSCSKVEPDLPNPAVTLTSGVPTSLAETTPATSSPSEQHIEMATPGNLNVSNNNLLIVYEKFGNLWVSEREINSQLTSGGEDSSPKLSRDGKVVVFQRSEELWVVDISGRNEQKLFGETGKVPLHYEFINDDQKVLFTTRNLDGEPLYDLNIGDVGRGESRALLPPGQGGMFVTSPDSNTLALVQPDKIFIYNLTDGTTSVLYRFLPAMGLSGLFLPPIAWLENGYGFKTIIPSVDGRSNLFLFIPANGEKPARLAEFSSLPPNVSDFFISPDGSRVLYLKDEGENVELHAIDASTTDSIYLRKPRGKLGIIGWSADSKTIIIWLETPDSVWSYSSNTISKFSNSARVTNISWITSDICLFKSELELRLMTQGQQSIVIDSGVSGTYDAVKLR